MKKLLALVLALVMTLGLATVGTSAAYSDADSINYKEAVDVMSSIGVLAGDENGFRPTDTLKRSEGAKIIAYLLVGNKTAEALQGTGSKFTDVAAKDWYAGYVEYLASVGVIGGVGGGKFDPNGSLTANQFAKMLLTALGYDAKIEGLVGADWAINTQKLANQVELFDGNSNVAGTAAITREEAALYAFNTLQAPVVQYDNKGSSVSVNGATIEFGASNATYRTSAAVSNSRYTAINDAYLNGNRQAQIVEFAEEYYPNLVKSSGTDDFMRDVTVWTYKNDKIGEYAKAATKSYTANTAFGTIYTDLGLTKTMTGPLYIDGVENGTLTLRKGDTAKTTYNNGALVEVYYDQIEATLKFVVINTWVGDVVKTVAATASKDQYIVIAPDGDAKPSNIGGGTANFETDEKFEDDAVVLYTYSVAAKSIDSVKLAKKVSGTVTQAQNANTNNQNTASVTIDGTTYKAAAKFAGDEVGTVTVKGTYDLYLDEYDYMIRVDEVEELSDNYALVLATAASNQWVGYRAKLLFTDGTTKQVVTEKDYSTGTNKINNNTIVTFRKDDKDVYTLKPVSTTGTNAGSATTFALTTNSAGVTIQTGVVRTANSATTFVVQDQNDTDSYKAYTGVKNAPTITAAGGAGQDVTAYYYCRTGNMLTAMFIFPGTNATITNAKTDILYITNRGVSNLTHDADGDYYTYHAVVNDEIKDVKIDAAVKVDATTLTSAQAKQLSGVYNGYNSDKYGIIESTATYGAYDPTNVTAAVNYAYAGAGLAKTSKDYTVTLGTTSVSTGNANETITVASDAKVYYVTWDGGKIEAINYNSITPDDNDLVFAIVKDYQVTNLYIQERPETFVVAPTFDEDDPTGAVVNTAAAKIYVDFVNTAAKGAETNGTAVIADNVDLVKTIAGSALQNMGYTVTATAGAALNAITITATNGVSTVFDVVPTMYDKIVVDGEVLEYVASGLNGKATAAPTKATKTTIQTLTDAGSGFIITIDDAATKYVANATSDAILTDISTALKIDGNVYIETGYVKVTLGGNADGYTKANTAAALTKAPTGVTTGHYYRLALGAVPTELDSATVLTAAASNVTLTSTAQSADDITLKEVWLITVTPGVAKEDANGEFTFTIGTAAAPQYSTYDDKYVVSITVAAKADKAGTTLDATGVSLKALTGTGTIGTPSRVGADAFDGAIGTGANKFTVVAGKTVTGGDSNTYTIEITGINQAETIQWP